MTYEQGIAAEKKAAQIDRNWVFARAITALIAVGIAVSFCILYTAYAQKRSDARWAEAQRQSDQRWCELFVGLDDNNRSLPPARKAALTAQQRKFIDDVHKLRQELHCADTPTPSPSQVRVTPTK